MNVSTRNPGAFGAIGIFVVFAFTVAVNIAAYGDPSWIFGENTLSDLGVSDVQLSADLFNYGCVIGGILICIVGLGKAVCEQCANRASGMFLAFAGLLLLLIGFVHKDFDQGNTHLIIAILLFVFILAAALCSGYGDAKEGYRLNAAFTGIMILVAIGYAIGNSLAAAETVAVICALMWILSISVKMVFQARKG